MDAANTAADLSSGKIQKPPAPVGWAVIPTFQVQGVGGLLILLYLLVIFQIYSSFNSFR